jgi:hypothetical protein
VKIVELLKSMGNTADEVAEYLRQQDIKGERCKPSFCPIIIAIYKAIPDLCQGLRVDTRAGWMTMYGQRIPIQPYVVVTWNDCQTLDPSCPQAIEDFVFKFDRGEYPDLIGKSKEIAAKDALAKLTPQEKLALGL